MIKPDDVMEVFRVLDRAGFLTPWRAMSGSARRIAVESTARVWAAVLADLSADALQAACLSWCRSGNKWWPTTAQILERAPGAEPPLPTPAEVFEWLMMLISPKGSRTVRAELGARAAEVFGPSVSTPLARGVRAVGGVAALGRLPLNPAGGAWAGARGQVLSRFSEAYTAAAERARMGLLEDWPSVLTLEGGDERGWMQ